MISSRDFALLRFMSVDLQVTTQSLLEALPEQTETWNSSQ